MGQIFEKRAKLSRTRLSSLVAKSQEKLDARGEPLCIYVTGSYGRLEASDASDLDLFFLLESDDPKQLVKRLSWLRLSGELIALVEELKFPDFSGDGEFLEVHNVARMQEQLGSRTEDSENTFTARLLLLLESRPIFETERYSRLLRKAVDFYFESSLAALNDHATRAMAKQQSTEFGDLVFTILDATAHPDQRRYLTT